ncbi:MAG: hypothetical protein HC924_06215 [Synechococcaceae cyanobacterium SM2_3_2]|nr:hypothetical protein [Synechococcaceae cyanobacterium SM2_3_2]
MGLDAWVWCNCVETGQLTTPHPYPELLYIDEEGCPDIRSDEDDKIKAHRQWEFDNPCRHENFTLLHHRIGNISLVASLRKAVSHLSEDAAVRYPVLWSKVIYSGVHCGDWLKIEDVKQLKDELDRLRLQNLNEIDEEDAYFLRGFIQQMEELIQASLSVNKPIVF